MSYTCDVFVSYRNKGEMGDWVRHTLVPLLRDFLHEAGVPDPNLFVDAQVEDGKHWPTEISSEHHGAKVHLLVVSEPYWLSKWCVSEAIGAFLRDDKRHPHPSIFIVRFNDLDTSTEARQRLDKLMPGLADLVHGVQRRDLENFIGLDLRYHRARLDMPDFFKELRSFAKNMAPSIMNPRPLREDIPPLPPISIPPAPPMYATFGART
jgi:hypothetical protein